METAIVLLASATAASVVKLIDGIIQWYLKRKQNQEDIEEINFEKDHNLLIALQNGLKVILLDRLQHFCITYIKQKEVDVNDLNHLHLMHNTYHELGGNGDLDKLIEKVEKLPIK